MESRGFPSHRDVARSTEIRWEHVEPDLPEFDLGDIAIADDEEEGLA